MRRRLTALAVLVVTVAVIVALALPGHPAPKKHKPAAAHKPVLAATHSSATPTALPLGPLSSTLRLHLSHVITGAISSKSVDATGTGLVLAQNMMYRHTVTVYNARTFRLTKTIPDAVRLSAFGYSGHPGMVRGAPVEAAITPDRRFAYISNYSMYGAGFAHEGHDVGGPSSGYDRSFVYRLNLATLTFDQVIAVGAVPKYVAVTPDGRYTLVSNWTSYTLSVIRNASARAVHEIPMGPYPRGIAVDSKSRYAYVAVMGTTTVAKVSLRTFARTYFTVGPGPRHVVISPDDRWLYVTLNAAGTIAKVDLRTDRVVRTVATGRQPRSMAMAADGASLYVVNYASNTVSQVRTRDMKVLQVLNTNSSPIGVTYEPTRRNLWVSCYSGSIMVFACR
jgi:YVTN family beta-propeller protein